jgi:hypothetical protein
MLAPAILTRVHSEIVTMFVRLPIVATVALLGSLAFANAALAQANNLCKSGDVLDEGRQVCYSPSAGYKPNFPEQNSIFSKVFGAPDDSKPAANTADGSAPAAPAASSSSSSSGSSSSGIMGWISDQARFCRYGDKQVGNGDAAYCVTKAGKTYPAGK